MDVDHGVPPFLPTSEMLKFRPGLTDVHLSKTGDNPYHTIFTGPPGFSGLDVLAFHDDNGNGTFDGETIDHVLILGGL